MAVGSTQLPNWWVSGVLCVGVKHLWCELTSVFVVVPSVVMRGDIPPLFHMHSGVHRWGFNFTFTILKRENFFPVCFWHRHYSENNCPALKPSWNCCACLNVQWLFEERY
jgi:hypothetical protein